MIARAAILFLALVAGGCTTVAPPTAAGVWPARRAALQALAAWTLDGRIAVAAGEEGFSGGLDWAQSGERADILLSGPMGGDALAIRVEGDEAAVSLRGEPLPGAEADRLLARYFGPQQRLPVRQMRYWLVGAPAPDGPHEETLGADQRLASLAQSGWTVRYARYEPVGALELPGRLELTTEGLRLRVVVSHWRLPP